MRNSVHIPSPRFPRVPIECIVHVARREGIIAGQQFPARTSGRWLCENQRKEMVVVRTGSTRVSSRQTGQKLTADTTGRGSFWPSAGSKKGESAFVRRILACEKRSTLVARRLTANIRRAVRNKHIHRLPMAQAALRYTSGAGHLQVVS